MTAPSKREFTLEPENTERLANLAGPFDAHLRQIELRLGVEIANRGNIFKVTGPAAEVKATEKLLRSDDVFAFVNPFGSGANAAAVKKAVDAGALYFAPWAAS